MNNIISQFPEILVLWTLNKLTMKNFFLIASVFAFVSCSDTEAPKEIKVEKAEVTADNNTEDLIQKRCLICHGAGESHDDLLAPPMRGVKNYYLKDYPDKEDFVEAIVKWNANPDSANAIMVGAVTRFKVMPSLQYPENEVRAIAAYIYENEQPKPSWMKGKSHKGMKNKSKQM